MGRHKASELSDEMIQKVTLAAELYYVYHLTQLEVAAQMDISRVWVGKLLRKAEELGIVRIKVCTDSAGVRSLEAALVEKYGIKRAKVVHSPEEDLVLQTCGRAAAHYLTGILQKNDRISIFWGETLAAMVAEFLPLYFPEVTVTPFVGGIGFDARVIPNQIAFQLAEKLSARIHPLHAPCYVTGSNQRNLLLQDPIIRSALEMSESADILIVGMGALRHPTLVRTRSVSNREFAELEALGAIGDVSLHFMDCRGRIVRHSVHERMISADLERARRHAREVIGVACGKGKARIWHAALSGGWIDTVITDEAAAAEMLCL